MGICQPRGEKWAVLRKRGTAEVVVSELRGCRICGVGGQGDGSQMGITKLRNQTKVRLQMLRVNYKCNLMSCSVENQCIAYVC